MSNITIFQSGDLTNGDYVLPEEGMSELTKSVASTNNTNRRIQISTNGSFRRVVNGQQIGKAISGEFYAIVVGMQPKVSRKFYAGEYDPNAKGRLPDCWSNLGDKPEEASSDKQSANCVTCPQNVKGSAPGNRKACRYERRVALVIPGLGSEVYQFAIPAGSLFGEKGDNESFEGYVKFLIANNASIDRVVTKIAYDLTKQTTVLKFTPARPITRDELELVKEAQADPACERATRLTVAAIDGAKQLDKPSATNIFEEEAVEVEAVSEKPSKQPVSQEPDWGSDEEAEFTEVKAEAPKKRVEKKAKSEPKADLESVIAEWGDDD
jgi:hypothetical protein